MGITIIGNSGSGKSTLAGRLAAESGASVLDLDTVAWEPGKIAVPRDADDAWTDVREFCASNERWIVEGCYASLAEASLSFEPNLLVLDPGPGSMYCELPGEALGAAQILVESGAG